MGYLFNDCIVKKFSRHGDSCVAYVMDEKNQ